MPCNTGTSVTALRDQQHQGLKALLKRAFPAPARHFLRGVWGRCSSFTSTTCLELFHSRRIRKVSGPNLLVNIGCGKLFKSNWINLDRQVSPGVYYANLVKGIPMPAQSVRHIHCEHFLEHLEYAQARIFLAECYRVLQAGGSLRLIMPDAGKYLRAYGREDGQFFERLKDLGGAVEPFKTRMEIINQMFRMGGDHRFAWDFETLSLALRECRFNTVKLSSVHDVEREFDIDGDDWWRSFESLYVNASKQVELSL
jgi:predicted SAM-dependent methyltransferase